MVRCDGGYRVPFIKRLVNPPELPLVKNGRINKENMKKEFLTKEDLLSHLRELGIEVILS